ncbi:MAG: hypothetical protein RLZZ598_1651 [Pseudomonadota bacterium]
MALITGGARRIGRSIALELAAHGHDIALHHRGPADDPELQHTLEALRRVGVRAEPLVAELSDEAQCRALVPAVVARFGRLDAVVNNAARFVEDSVFDFGFAAMEAHWRANTAPALILARELHAHLVARGAAPASGCVVNLLDQKLWNPNPDHLSYTLSKAALEAAQTLLAQALAPWVRVCGVAPGVTMPSGPMDAAEFERAHRLTPLERSSTPADVARAVRFLIESPAITGTTLLVDGGQHLLKQPRDVLHIVRGQQS